LDRFRARFRVKFSVKVRDRFMARVRVRLSDKTRFSDMTWSSGRAWLRQGLRLGQD
jgi:hypothetical protein